MAGSESKMAVDLMLTRPYKMSCDEGLIDFRGQSFQLVLVLNVASYKAF